jgi:hypothetical protein
MFILILTSLNQHLMHTKSAVGVSGKQRNLVYENSTASVSLMEAMYCVSQFDKCLQYWLSALVAPEPSVIVSSQAVWWNMSTSIAAHYNYTLVWASFSSKPPQVLHTCGRRCSDAWRTVVTEHNPAVQYSAMQSSLPYAPCLLLHSVLYPYIGLSVSLLLSLLVQLSCADSCSAVTGFLLFIPTLVDPLCGLWSQVLCLGGLACVLIAQP